MKPISTKIIADVSEEVKQKLADIAHHERESMKQVLVRLIEREHENINSGEEQ